MRWHAMILMYSKSGILLQLHFLWSPNSNLQIIVNYCSREKISTTTLCTKTRSVQELKVLIHFILNHHHLQSKKLSTSTIEHFSHYGCPQVSEKKRMTPKVCQFPSKYILHLSTISNLRYPQFQKEKTRHNKVHISK